MSCSVLELRMARYVGKYRTCSLVGAGFPFLYSVLGVNIFDGLLMKIYNS